MGTKECDFWQSFTAHFDFSQPITFSDIISILALIAAVVAAIVAICGNTQAQNALKETERQFQESMREQNRAINVSLFDFRMEILASIEAGKFNFNRTRVQLLFENDISDKIKEYDEATRERDRYNGLKREFLDLIRSLRVDDTYEEATDFLETIQDYDSADPDSPDYQQLQETIRKNSYTGKWVNGASPFEVETVDYIDASEQEMAFYSKAEGLRKEIIEEMRKFIEASIR